MANTGGFRGELRQSARTKGGKRNYTEISELSDSEDSSSTEDAGDRRVDFKGYGHQPRGKNFEKLVESPSTKENMSLEEYLRQESMKKPDSRGPSRGTITKSSHRSGGIFDKVHPTSAPLQGGPKPSWNQPSALRERLMGSYQVEAQSLRSIAPRTNTYGRVPTPHNVTPESFVRALSHKGSTSGRRSVSHIIDLDTSGSDSEASHLNTKVAKNADRHMGIESSPIMILDSSEDDKDRPNTQGVKKAQKFVGLVDSEKNTYFQNLAAPHRSELQRHGEQILAAPKVGRERRSCPSVATYDLSTSVHSPFAKNGVRKATTEKVPENEVSRSHDAFRSAGSLMGSSASAITEDSPRPRQYPDFTAEVADFGFGIPKGKTRNQRPVKLASSQHLIDDKEEYSPKKKTTASAPRKRRKVASYVQDRSDIQLPLPNSPRQVSNPVQTASNSKLPVLHKESETSIPEASSLINEKTTSRLGFREGQVATHVHNGSGDRVPVLHNGGKTSVLKDSSLINDKTTSRLRDRKRKIDCSDDEQRLLYIDGKTSVGKTSISKDSSLVTKTSNDRPSKRQKISEPILISSGDDLPVFNAQHHITQAIKSSGKGKKKAKRRVSDSDDDYSPTKKAAAQAARAARAAQRENLKEGGQGKQLKSLSKGGGAKTKAANQRTPTKQAKTATKPKSSKRRSRRSGDRIDSDDETDDNNYADSEEEFGAVRGTDSQKVRISARKAAAQVQMRHGGGQHVHRVSGGVNDRRNPWAVPKYERYVTLAEKQFHSSGQYHPRPKTTRWVSVAERMAGLVGRDWNEPLPSMNRVGSGHGYGHDDSDSDAEPARCIVCNRPEHGSRPCRY